MANAGSLRHRHLKRSKASTGFRAQTLVQGGSSLQASDLPSPGIFQGAAGRIVSEEALVGRANSMLMRVIDRREMSTEKGKGRELI
jgi:hypothetical protein